MYRVLLLTKYYNIKRLVVILSLLVVSLFAQAQEADSTAPADQNNNETNTKNYNDASKERKVYFLQKELQQNGGGPDSIQWRKLPDSTLKRMSQDENFWYVNYVFNKQKKVQDNPREKESFTEQPLFQTILWLVIIGGFVAFIIIYLSNSNAALFRRKSRTIHGEEDISYETGNIFEINYAKEIDKAIRENNYRLAVRLLFLRSLTRLSNKNIIDYKLDRTNFDYLVQLRPTNYYTDFFRLTRNYEYCWYGQFDIDPGKFGILKNDFENFDSRLN
jgi:hypothetical protein